jgi:hypothetical protein
MSRIGMRHKRQSVECGTSSLYKVQMFVQSLAMQWERLERKNEQITFSLGCLIISSPLSTVTKFGPGCGDSASVSWRYSSPVSNNGKSVFGTAPA